MAEYRGFTCDDCGAVVDKDKRTQKTVKFRGPVTEGEFSEDLCPDCVHIPEGVEMKPLRKRATHKDGASPVAEDGAEVRVVPSDSGS